MPGRKSEEEDKKVADETVRLESSENGAKTSRALASQNDSLHLQDLSGNNNKQDKNKDTDNRQNHNQEEEESSGQFGPTSSSNKTNRSTLCSTTSVATEASTSSSNITLQVPSSSRLTKTGGDTHQGSTLVCQSPILHEPYSFDEEADVILNCKALHYKVLGRLMKSFSTTDITDCFLLSNSIREAAAPSRPVIRPSISEVILSGETALLNHLEQQTSRRLDLTSRSCSTWVAVGDTSSVQHLFSSNSQLHSPSTPQTSAIEISVEGSSSLTPGGREGLSLAESIIGSTTASANISPIGLLRSVNKKVREMYIRKRIVSTYRALERLSKSQFDLTGIKEGGKATGVSRLVSSPSTLSITTFTRRLTSPPDSPKESRSRLTVPSSSGKVNTVSSVSKLVLNWEKLQEDLSALTVRDIEQQKGKPLSKYERNIMIFNWLQELEQEPDQMSTGS